MKFIHYAMLVCASLATGLPNLAPALPPGADPYVRAAVSVLVLVVSVLGAVSKSALDDAAAPAQALAPSAPQAPAPQPAPALADASAKPVAP